MNEAIELRVERKTGIEKLREWVRESARYCECWREAYKMELERLHIAAWTYRAMTGSILIVGPPGNVDVVARRLYKEKYNKEYEEIRL